MRGRNNLFKLLALLLSLALLAAACGGDDDDDESTGGDDTTETTAEDDGGDDEGGGEKIGLVYDTTGRGDQSFNDSAARGLDKAKEDFGVQTKDLTPSGGGENRAELLSLLADEGYPLVFAVGFAFAEDLGPVAEQYPDTTFAIIDGFVEADNVASISFAENEGAFLMGAAAALKSTTGKVGFIGGVEVPLIKKFQAGFEAGAKQVEPDIEIDVKYITPAGDFTGFNDPAKAKVIAGAMYSGGADVIFHAAGASGIGLFDAAVEAGDGMWAIGVDSDQYLTASPEQQEHILTSMIKSVDVAVYDNIEAFVDGSFETGPQTFDLASGGIAYATSGGFIDDITDQLDELQQQIVDGEIEVPEEL